MTPAPLTITADDRSKRYGQSLGFRGTEFTARGLVNGDAVTSVDLASRGASRGAQVGEGPFRITASNAEGDGLANYTISYVEGLLRVTPAPLVVTADDQGKRFGQEFVFNGTEFTTRGLVNGDAVTSALLRSDGAPATALPSSQPYAIDISDAQGQGLSFGGVLNYDITYVPGELLVVPPPQRIPPDPSRLPTFDAGLRLVYYDYLPNPPDEVEIAGTEAFGTGGGSGGPTLGPTRPRRHHPGAGDGAGHPELPRGALQPARDPRLRLQPGPAEHRHLPRLRARRARGLRQRARQPHPRSAPAAALGLGGHPAVGERDRRRARRRRPPHRARDLRRRGRGDPARGGRAGPARRCRPPSSRSARPSS